MKSIQDCGEKGRERFRCAQAGCQECVNGLLLEHRKLVVAVVRKQWLGERAAYADLVQEGNMLCGGRSWVLSRHGGWPSARMLGGPSSEPYGQR